MEYVKKISIVMPVYNCEAYLKESVESVLHQSLQEWELLCVDDGSNDGSLAILREFQTIDSRIQIYTQSNQGAGVARNLAMKHTRGEYIAFLDADDFFFDEDALENMYDVCEKNHVNACGSTIKLFRNGVIAVDTGFKEIGQAAQAKPVLSYRDFQFDYGFTGFIFKAEIIKNNGIEFPAYRRFEDPPFFVHVMHRIKKFAFIDKSLYCYRTPNVAVRFDVIKTVDLLKGLLDNMEFASKNNLDILFERTLRRLEVEYSNIICRNIMPESTDILELLLKVNQLVKKVYKKGNYVIQPLQKVLRSVSEAEEFHKEKVYKLMDDCDRIYLYGAGNAATDLLLHLEKIGLLPKVASIIVTSKEGNPEEIKGIPVISLDTYQYTEGDLVLITVTSLYREEIVQNLQAKNVRAYELLDTGMLKV